MQNIPPPPPEPNLKEWLYALIGLRKRMKITGKSMHPTLKQGDLVLINTNAYKNTPPQANDIVVLWHPTIENLRIVKRIKQRTENNHYYVISDNPAGQDSRHYGPVSPNNVIGKVTGHSSAPQNK